MTTTTHGKLGAYSVRQKSEGQGNREIDARALLSCASRLQMALDAGKNDMVAYASAVKHNQRLWTIFQVAVCDPENPLPQDLKMTMLSLSRYVDKTSFRAVTEFLPNLVESMISINRTIAAGLMKTSNAAVEADLSQNVVPPHSIEPGVTSLMTSA